jgi:hypothetical protein
MANPEIIVHMSAVSVGGTATCNVCGALFSWKLPLDSLDGQLPSMRCPQCGAFPELDEKSTIVELEIDAAGKKERVLAAAGDESADHA